MLGQATKSCASVPGEVSLLQLGILSPETGNCSRDAAVLCCCTQPGNARCARSSVRVSRPERDPLATSSDQTDSDVYSLSATIYLGPIGSCLARNAPASI